MNALWPAWLGALALGVLTPLVFAVTGRMLGVSGFWARALSRSEQRKVAAAYVASLDERRMEAALERATLEAFGTLPAAALQSEPIKSVPKVTPPLPWATNIVFLACVALGGLLAALSRGERAPVVDPSLQLSFGSAWPIALVGGGFLVGLGTRLAGGCTSGHGLSGCGSLQPGSLVATAVYFLTGVLVSFGLTAW